MRFEIEVNETVSKINTYIVEVDSEEEGESLLNMIEDDIDDVTHPDDISYVIQNAGYEIVKKIEGVEDFEAELY